MKILTKFIGSSVALIGLILTVTISSEYLLKQADKSTEFNRLQAEQASDLVQNLKVSLRDQIAALNNYLILNRLPSDMAKYYKAMSKFKLYLDELETLMPEDSNLIVVRRRHNFLSRLATELREQPTKIDRTQQDFRVVNSYQDDIDFSLDLLVNSVKEKGILAKREANKFKQTTQIVRYSIAFVIILVFGVQLVLILLPVIHSIQKLQIGATQIGTGDLDYRLDIRTKDEIEQLSCEFNRMASKLAESYRSLEQKVNERTAALSSLNQNLEIKIAERKQAEVELQQALQNLKQTQAQLIQTEKMSSLGQLVAGVAHEINNPVNFIYGNITYASEYIQTLLDLVALYQEEYPNPTPRIIAKTEESEIEFLNEDLPKLISSMKVGTQRIREIVLSLRNFSRLDEAEIKLVDIHEGIDSTLLILQNRLKAKPNHVGIEIIKEYGNLPSIDCYAGQLNQVFMNLLTNAIDALEELYYCQVELLKNSKPTIWIRTQVINSTHVSIHIKDNGPGLDELVLSRLFDPFFTTKPVGKGTGLGLSICYQIVVEKHGGQLQCFSKLSEGAEFVVELPIRLQVTHRQINLNNNLLIGT